MTSDSCLTHRVLGAPWRMANHRSPPPLVDLQQVFHPLPRPDARTAAERVIRPCNDPVRPSPTAEAGGPVRVPGPWVATGPTGPR